MGSTGLFWPLTGTLSAKPRAFAIVTPIRVPVNEPGPGLTSTSVISSCLKPSFSRHESKKPKTSWLRGESTLLINSLSSRRTIT